MAFAHFFLLHVHFPVNPLPLPQFPSFVAVSSPPIGHGSSGGGVGGASQPSSSLPALFISFTFGAIGWLSTPLFPMGAAAAGQLLQTWAGALGLFSLLACVLLLFTASFGIWLPFFCHLQFFLHFFWYLNFNVLT